MEDDLKILKVEHLSNHLFGHTQILKLSLYDKTRFYESIKWRRPQMEDDLKQLKVEYLSNYLLEHTKILELSLYDQTIFYKSLKWRRPQNIKSVISQQPYIGSYPNFKLGLRWPIHNKSLKWRRPPMEDNLQWKTTSNGRRPHVQIWPHSL